MTPTVLDKTDYSILSILQENGRLTTKQIAERVNLSSTPVFERIKRLEREGYIRKYVGFEAFCSVKLRQMSKDVAENFVRIIKEIPQVMECYNISGEYDYLLKIRSGSMKEYNDFIINVLGTVDAIGSIQSSFVMNEIKHSYGLYF